MNPTAPSAAPAISSTLYLGLLFAQEDRGGSLQPYKLGRTVFPYQELQRGLDACGCIHGAAYLWGGFEHGETASCELDEAGISAPRFDSYASNRIYRGLSVTVDSTLLDCGVEVKE